MPEDCKCVCNTSKGFKKYPVDGQCLCNTSQGYKEQPENGKCVLKASMPNYDDYEDKYCDVYAYLFGSKLYDTWRAGCVKVCKQCCRGYYRDCDYVCKKLPLGCLDYDIDNECCTSCNAAEGYTMG